MTLDDQICLPSQARKLKDLGVTQDALFFGIMEHNDKWGELIHRGDFTQKYWAHPENHWLAAFNVAELGIMLQDTPRWQENKSEAIFRAEVLIEQLEEGTSSVAHCNNLLKLKV